MTTDQQAVPVLRSRSSVRVEPAVTRQRRLRWRTIAPAAVPAGLRRIDLTRELWLVFLLSLGMSGVYAVLQLVNALSAPRALSTQAAVLNASATSVTWLDLVYQLVAIGRGLLPVLLVFYLLGRAGESAATIGFDLRRPGADLTGGALLAAIVGGTGLGLYLASYAFGASLAVVPTTLPDVWWRIPVLVLSAWQNAILEEVLVVGFLLRRLDQLGWQPRTAIAVSSLIRGSYHLYQGFGGFVGNAIMGVLFGWLYRRTGRVAPLIVAHALIDTVAFVGYVLLAGRVNWLPLPG